jgi:hypothetical protein
MTSVKETALIQPISPMMAPRDLGENRKMTPISIAFPTHPAANAIDTPMRNVARMPSLQP